MHLPFSNGGPAWAAEAGYRPHHSMLTSSAFHSHGFHSPYIPGFVTTHWNFSTVRSQNHPMWYSYQSHTCNSHIPGICWSVFVQTWGDDMARTVAVSPVHSIHELITQTLSFTVPTISRHNNACKTEMLIADPQSFHPWNPMPSYRTVLVTCSLLKQLQVSQPCLLHTGQTTALIASSHP